MHALIDFAYFVINSLLGLLVFLVIAYAVVSMLIGFGIVNVRNRFAYTIWRALEAIGRPLLRPIQRILPSVGNLDFSPFVFIIVVGGIQTYLLPAFFRWLHALAGPGIAY